MELLITIYKEEWNEHEFKKITAILKARLTYIDEDEISLIQDYIEEHFVYCEIARKVKLYVNSNISLITGYGVTVFGNKRSHICTSDLYQIQKYQKELNEEFMFKTSEIKKITESKVNYIT